MRYSDVVMSHFWAPHNARVMPDADVIGGSGTPGRGPFMLLYLKLDGAWVLEASFQTNGCPPCIAAGSLLVSELTNTNVLEATARWPEESVAAALGGLPLHKRHCSALAANALAHACVQAVQQRLHRDEAPVRALPPDLEVTRGNDH